MQDTLLDAGGADVDTFGRPRNGSSAEIPIDTLSDAAYPAWRWLVLFAFSCSTGMNAIMFMDFVVVPDISTEAFNLNNVTAESTLTWTYSASLIAVVPAAIPAIYFLGKHNWRTSFVGVLCNFLGGWCRWLAVHEGSIAIAVLSSIFIGFSASVIICSYSSISQRWFAKHERTLACSIAVQSNYAGWCLGAVLIPYSVKDVAGLLAFQFWQGVAITLTLLLFLLFHREGPPGHTSNAEHEHEELSAGESLCSLLGNGQFCMQCICYAVLAGVSFGVPGFQTSAFSHILTERQTAWTNCSFILSGVVVGLAAGLFVKDASSFPSVLKGMFVAASASLVLLLAIFAVHTSFSHDTVFTLLLLAMAICGGSSLGFIGVALSAISETAKPVGSEYAGGSVEWWIQIFGASLAQVGGSLEGSGAFWVCAVCTWVATLVLVLAYRRPGEADRASSIYGDS